MSEAYLTAETKARLTAHLKKGRSELRRPINKKDIMNACEQIVKLYLDKHEND